MKKTLYMTVVLMAMSLSAWASSARHELNLIVAPARFSVMQVMFDVINHRSCVLVSYQENKKSSDPLLHVWNGASWNEISLHDLREMSFVQKTPKRAILVGDDDLLPVSIKDALSWMPELVIVRQLDNASLLNEFGRITKWRSSEWAWFSTRYNLKLDDEAAALRNSSWYDQTGPLLKKTEPVYEPVPYIKGGADANPSAADDASTMSAVERPRDIPQEPAEAVVDNTAYDNDIKEIVDTLEQGATAAPVANEK